jgi:hypothetical protein
MDLSINNGSILSRAPKAFNNFKSCKIPFAAVKLNVYLQNTNKKKIDEIVKDNFRSEKDLIFKEDQNYIILMKRTTFEAAEMAVNRLKAKIGYILAQNNETLKDSKHVHASAYILGSSMKTKQIHVKYLDLNPTLNSFDRSIHKMPFDYSEYLRWVEPPQSERSKINKMINIVV